MGEAGGRLPTGPGVWLTEVDKSRGAEVLLSTVGAVGCTSPSGMPRSRKKTLVLPPGLPPTQTTPRASRSPTHSKKWVEIRGLGERNVEGV